LLTDEIPHLAARLSGRPDGIIKAASDCILDLPVNELSRTYRLVDHTPRLHRSIPEQPADGVADMSGAHSCRTLDMVD
jgi:hypothetical protein